MKNKKHHKREHKTKIKDKLEEKIHRPKPLPKQKYKHASYWLEEDDSEIILFPRDEEE